MSKDLSIKDGGSDDLVATAVNTVYDITKLSNHTHNEGLHDLIVWLIRVLAEETEDMTVDNQSAVYWKTLLTALLFDHKE